LLVKISIIFPQNQRGEYFGKKNILKGGWGEEASNTVNLANKQKQTNKHNCYTFFFTVTPCILII